MNFSYKIVFILFYACFVFPTKSPSAKTFKNHLSKYFLLFLSSLPFLFHAYVFIYNLNFSLSLETSTAMVMSLVIHLGFRYKLLRKMNTLKRIAKCLSGFGNGKDPKLQWCLYSWIALSIIGHGVLFLSFTITLLQKPQTFLYNLFGLSEKRNFLYSVAAVFYEFYFSFLKRLPLTIFAMFFVVVCLNVRCNLKEFSNKLTEEVITDYKILRSFNSFKRSICILDRSLSFLILCEMINTSAVFFNYVLVRLHKNLKTKSVSDINIYVTMFLFFDNIIVFIAISASACMVSEVYSNLISKAKTLIISNETEFMYSQQKLVLCVEKEANFTVWNITPIKRSFVMYTFGAIMTYTALFDNFIFDQVKI